MIKNILIAEDIDSINTGILSILKEKFSFNIQHASSCDNAFLKIKKAIQENNPFDLIISDLSFKSDGMLTPKLKDGEELVNMIKTIQPEIKSIIYTIEDKPSLIKRLKEVSEVNGIVLKGSLSLNELVKAITHIDRGENYFTQEVLQLIKNDSTATIEPYDIILLEHLAQGLSQEEISFSLKKNNITPTSISAIEKKINRLKNILKAKNNIQMIAIAKDMSLI